MTVLLCLIFFFSGATALIFEALWFNQAGLALGNSVWASSLVLSGFMGGLALGNFLAARERGRIRNPIAFYAGAEAVIGIIGVGLVFLLPALGPILSGWLGSWVEVPWVVNPIRLLTAFILLMLPATAMGLTLPLLTKALVEFDPNFGSVLGKLYGWNTLGAVLGVVFSEIVLIERFGIRTTAVMTGGINLALAAAALFLSRSAARGSGMGRPERYYLNVWRSGKIWLIAGFLSGFGLLALEVVWFRFLLLFITGLSLSFALMLAVVLAGIALGGLSASLLLRRWPEMHRLGVVFALGAGMVCIFSYSIIPLLMSPPPEGPYIEARHILGLALPLMFPVSFISGIFFTLMGAALRVHIESDTAASGALTFANTFGAALGSLAAGFILLPTLGMEGSFFFIALLYGVIGWILIPAFPYSRRAVMTGGGIFLLSLVLFPFGDMRKYHMQVPIGWSMKPNEGRIAGVREGLLETIIYLERTWLGKPLFHRMLTNSYSMSASHFQSRRYQKAYVYLPLAVHPNPKNALLISYGVGNTAKALTDSRELEVIDVVDISRDVLEMNRVVYPEADEHPLHDPRVQVHVEDGRFFLQSTDRRFDLITAEPPPPSVAGVVNLYSREYFELLYDRLAEGGMVTYWLPLHDLSEGSAKAVIRAFCDAFADCSLWHGQWTNLMLMGTRNAGGPVSPDHFMRQWSDPALVDELAALGFERPEQLGALFIGDAGFVQETLPGALPVTDDFPRRIISPSHDTQEMGRLFRLWTDVDAARGRFERSELIGRLWPSETREETLPFFEFQDMINDRWFSPRAGHEVAIEDVHRLLTETPLKVPILWLLGSSGDAQRVLEEVEAIDRENPQFYYHQGIRELSERNFPEAARLFEKAEIQESLRVKAFRFRVYATAMAGRLEEAKKLSRDGLEAYLREHFEDLRARGVAVPETYELTLPPFWAWMKQELGIDPAADFLKEKKPGKGGFSP